MFSRCSLAWHSRILRLRQVPPVPKIFTYRERVRLAALGDKVGPLLVHCSPRCNGTAEIDHRWIGGSPFAKKCAGSHLIFQFSFMTDGPPAAISFQLGDLSRVSTGFTIHSRARVPSIFWAPANPEKPKK